MSSKKLMNESDYYYPVGVCIEAIFFGFYTAVFIASLWIWGKRRSRASSAPFSEWLYLILTVSMWIVAFIHLGISIQRFLRVFITELEVDSVPTAIRLLDATRWDTLAHMVSMTTMIWLGDVLVLYRTFIVWNRNVLVIALPILIQVAYLVIDTIAIYGLSHPHIVPRKVAVLWYQPVFPLVFAQNVITTGLLFYKVWSQHCCSSANGVINANGSIELGHLAWMMIETAMLYTIELFVIIVMGAIQHPAKGIVSLALVPTLGIVFVFLAVRVHFGRAPSVDTRKPEMANNLPDLQLFRGSTSDHGIVFTPSSPASGERGRVNREIKQCEADDINTQHSEFEDQAQESLPTISDSRETSRERP